MKVSVNFYKNREVVKTENFNTKSEANKAIKTYTSSVRIHERVRDGICAYIN
jgi:hypothetical protein